MAFKVSKTLSYPFFILALVSFIAISVYSFLNSIGARMNPPQPAFKFEQEISKATIWLNEGGVWQFNSKARLSLFDTDNKRFLEGGARLEDLSASAFGEVLLLVVRESLDKEKSKKLLQVLSKFNLKKVYVASPYDDTMAALEKLEPRFWYAASPRSWVKWSLFSTFGLEKAFTLEVDFLLVDQDISKLMNGKLQKEIERRKLPMIQAVKDSELLFN